MVQAAGTDAWTGLRLEVARWFGRGDGQREQAELERLDQTADRLETAEAAAEWLHSRLRAGWGFPDGEVPKKELFQAHYRGRRYSFGYPACPDLEQQQTLFDILRPEDAGVALTEGFMMEPEASVSAMVFHHPDAVYFSAGPGEDDGDPRA